MWKVVIGKFGEDLVFLLYVEDGCEDGSKVADLHRRHMYAKPLLVEHHQNGLGNTQYMALCYRTSQHAKEEVRLQNFVYTYVNSTSRWMHNWPTFLILILSYGD